MDVWHEGDAQTPGHVITWIAAALVIAVFLAGIAGGVALAGVFS